MKQFATAKHLYRLWSLFKKLLSASESRIAALEKMMQIEDIGEYVLTVTDAECHIVMALDKRGRAQLPKGSLSLRDCHIEQSDEPGLFHLLDKNDIVLLGIDEEGNIDFKGIPGDIKAELDGIKRRLETLEKK